MHVIDSGNIVIHVGYVRRGNYGSCGVLSIFSILAFTVSTIIIVHVEFSSMNITREIVASLSSPIYVFSPSFSPAPPSQPLPLPPNPPSFL